MVLKPGSEAKARAIFEKWDLDFAIIGKITDTGRLTLIFKGEIVGDIPTGPLASNAPEYHRPWVPTPPRPEIRAEDVPAPKDISEALLQLIGSPDLSSRKWIWEQYDHMVMGDTILRPGGDAAMVRIHGTNKGLAVTTDCTPRYCFADPVQGGAQAVAETWRNITATGALPLAITDCMNFGNPERPQIMGQFVGCIQGMADACRALDYPVVSGNVSLYNETNGQGVLPTPAIGGVGVLSDISLMTTIAPKADGELVILIGETRGHLGSSIYLRDIAGREEGAPPPVDLAAERRNGDFVRGQIAARRVAACHDISDGGLAIALAEMAMSGARGMTISLPSGAAPQHAFLFGEDQARYALTAAPAHADEILAAAAKAGVSAIKIGVVGGIELKLDKNAPILISELTKRHQSWFADFMTQP